MMTAKTHILLNLGCRSLGVYHSILSTSLKKNNRIDVKFEKYTEISKHPKYTEISNPE